MILTKSVHLPGKKQNSLLINIKSISSEGEKIGHSPGAYLLSILRNDCSDDGKDQKKDCLKWTR